ncbi:MAG TPA: carboxylating nicotinate-nucleotide diphosphorylase [Actinomycetota bacterium]|nr:carboxylating nicotinate-nucleotide diphosphorylase [Actinomycetota bacterium]
MNWGVDDVIAVALAEDLGDGPDVTSLATIPAGHRSRLDLVARAAGVVAGLEVAGRVFGAVGPIEVAYRAADGDRVAAGDVLLSAVGPTRDLLTAERTALNLLTHLSGVATATAAWVEVLGPEGPKVRDTRKTLPGLRALQKYAVRCGGGVNHRMSLSDAALVKDNHVVAAGGVTQAFTAVRERFPGLPVEVEVDSLEQLEEVLAAGADLVLLDNFTPEQMREAVSVNAGRALLEASGGLTLASAAAVAGTGVDFVAIGALTHSVTALDIGADLQEVPDASDD